MGEIASDLALTGLRIVGRADARDQQQLHIEELKRAEQNQIGGLLEFLA